MTGELRCPFCDQGFSFKARPRRRAGRPEMMRPTSSVALCERVIAGCFGPLGSRLRRVMSSSVSSSPKIAEIKFPDFDLAPLTWLRSAMPK